MISLVNSSAIATAYPSKMNETQEEKKMQTTSSHTEISKIAKLKESIDSGEYKVNIDALSKKMAEDLL